MDTVRPDLTRSLREANQRLEAEILERERAHQSLVQANERLSREIEEHKRTTAKLEEARRRAGQASRAKSIFLANMSHEIRTPLNVILGMADMALRPDSQVDLTRALEMIREAGTVLRGLLGDLLDLSRVEAGRLVLETIPFCPRHVLQTVRNAHAFQAERQGLELVLAVDPELPETLGGDPGRLTQVLANLVTNALKFTPTGTVTLEARLVKSRTRPGQRPAAPETATLFFAVSDTGVGIDPEKKRLIFESFRQADDSVVRRFGGTGLGLSICRRLVGLMGGRIRVKSEPGQGSVFSFTARFKIVGPPEACAVDPVAAARDLPAGLDILLAEDSDLSAEMIEAFLIPKGHSVTRVVNGSEALAALAQRRFDLVLMDIQMPGMDGLTATRAIRSGREPGVDPDVPIVALTAHGLQGDRRRILRAGVTGYVAKPVNLDALLAAMARALEGDGREQTAGIGRTAASVRPDKGVEAEASEPFDAGRAEALENLGGDEALLARLAAIFLRDTPASRQKLEAAVAAGDQEVTALVAHSLKGNAGTIGASLAAARARELEMAARQGRRQEFAPLAQALFRELDRAMAGLAGQGITPAEG